MARPKGEISWASDATITGTGLSFDGSPPQVEPSAGIIAQGFHPGSLIPTGWLNWLADRIRKLSGYQDAIEVQNFAMGMDVVTTGVTANDPVAMCWCAARKAYFFAYNNAMKTSGQGKTWTTETLPGSGPDAFQCIETNGTHMVAAGGTYAGFVKWNGSAWALVVTTGVSGYKCAIAWNPGGYRFMLGGKLAADSTPRIVTLATDMATAAIVAKTMPSAYTDGTISHIIAAQNNSLTICVAIAGQDNTGASTGGLQTYYSTDAVTWTSNRITGITRSILEAWWDEFRALFYIVDNAGHMFSSTDGITFGDTGVVLPVDNTKPNALAHYGGVWVLCAASSAIKWSTDAGVTWSALPYDPFDDGTSGGQPYKPIHAVFTKIPATKDGTSGDYSRGDRFAILAGPTTSGANAVSFALRLR